MTAPSDVLAIARAELGTTEWPPGSNIVKYGDWYDSSDRSEPWCARFVSWCFYRAGLPQPAQGAKGFQYCPAGVQWYQRTGRWSTVPSVGAVVFYDWDGDGVSDHVGIVESVLIGGPGPGNPRGAVNTIEGNTSASNAGSQSNGGGVFARTRGGPTIMGYGLPAYGAPAAVPAGATGSHPVLRRGDSGPAVVDAQRFLQAFFNHGLAVDGAFGQQTEQTVDLWQSTHGLAVDGVIGPATWSTFDAAVAYVRAVAAAHR